MEKIRFTKDVRAEERGRERFWIDYGDRDRLGLIGLHQCNWFAEFRFNGKDFAITGITKAQIESKVVKAISDEYKAA